MSRLRYFTAMELMNQARDVMIPLENQLPAQQKIATIIAMHLARCQALNRGASPNEIVSASAFIAGSTGSGKSYIIKSLAEVCGLHFRQIDCASLTQAGVRGRNLSHCLDEIILENPTFFEDGGILNLDEVDKIFYKRDPHHDAYSPQQDLLKLFEGGNYSFAVDGRSKTINLDRTLILLSGACATITPILKRKHCDHVAIGFSNGIAVRTDIEDYASLITLEDLIAFGMIPEMASRVNTVIHIPKIDVNGYKMLLTADSKSSCLNRFKNHFAMRGIQFSTSSEAVEIIAAESVLRDVGARSVQSILNEKLLDAYRIADNDPSCHHVHLDVNSDGNLEVTYSYGKKLPVPDFSHAPKANNYSISLECSTDDQINQFADEMVSKASLDDVTDERLIYYFTQATCRFLGSEVRPSERTFENLLKLADTTRCESCQDNHKTPYDIICEDYLEKLKNDATHNENKRVQYTIFTHYYHSFRMENRKRSHVVLIEALKSAGQRYKPTMSNSTQGRHR